MKRHSPRRRTQSGFTLLTLILLLALGTVSALIVLERVSREQDLTRLFRQSGEAREAAEGGLMEILNDQQFGAQLPDLDTPGLRRTYTRDGASHFATTSAERGTQDYSATVDLVRIAPMQESSYSVVRAVIYEVRVEATAADGMTAGVEAQVYKIASTQAGTILPRTHAR